MRHIMSALILGLAVPATAPADELRALCETSAAMAAEAAEMRRATADEAEAATGIAEAHADAPSVETLAPRIAAWVWTLPADALEPEEIRTAFVAQCLEQGAAME